MFVLPHAKGRHIVITDAWDREVGTILPQNQLEKLLKIIVYGSKLFTQAKRW